MAIMTREEIIQLARSFNNLVDLVQWRAQHQPDDDVILFLADGESDEQHLTFAELDRRARAIGASLRSRAAPGERAVLLYPPGLDYVAAFFGCLYGGMVAVPAYPPDPFRLKRTLPRLLSIVADSHAAFVLTTSMVLSMTDLVFELAPGLREKT